MAVRLCNRELSMWVDGLRLVVMIEREYGDRCGWWLCIVVDGASDVFPCLNPLARLPAVAEGSKLTLLSFLGCAALSADEGCE
jgi:hypothetical protein